MLIDLVTKLEKEIGIPKDIYSFKMYINGHVMRIILDRDESLLITDTASKIIVHKETELKVGPLKPSVILEEIFSGTEEEFQLWLIEKLLERVD